MKRQSLHNGFEMKIIKLQLDDLPIFNNGILGKVVRVEEEGDMAYDVGVCFLRKDQRDADGVSELINTL